MSLRIGNAPTSWGVEKELVTERPPFGRFLDEVRESGYAGVELGPYGYLPTDAELLRRELARRDLELTAGYVMGALHDEDVAEELIAEAAEIVPLLSDLGAAHLVVIPGIVAERAATAGRSDAAPRLGGRELDRLLDTVARLGALSAAHGVRAGLHPHAGSYVEFADEIDRVLGALEPALVGLVLDTGHCAYAGIEPAQAILDHGARLSYVHLKDVDGPVLERCLAAGLGFWDAYRAGVFCVIGSGMNDFERVKESLQRVGYDGWLTVEQDADPSGASDPRTDAARSLAFLRQVGLAP
jgi:inosose dehydratase